MRTTLYALCALLALTCNTWAASESDKKTLKGITEVYVLIEEISKDSPPGLTVAALQTDVELRLRKAGIGAHDLSEKLPILPLLYVRVNCLSLSNGKVACSHAIELQQMVRLNRDPNIISFTATTWETGGIQITSSARDIRGYVGDFVDIFLNDCLAINPEKATLGSR
jgi:hypothetical protein